VSFPLLISGRFVDKDLLLYMADLGFFALIVTKPEIRMGDV
jgi:hypothetical protein